MSSVILSISMLCFDGDGRLAREPGPNAPGPMELKLADDGDGLRPNASGTKRLENCIKRNTYFNARLSITSGKK